MGHPDVPLIDESLSMLDGIIKHVDTRTGEAKCAFVKHKLRYTHDDQVCLSFFLLYSRISGGVLAWLSVWSEVRLAYGPADATATHCLLPQ